MWLIRQTIRCSMQYQNDRTSLRVSMLIVGAGAISTFLAQPDLIDLPIRRLLKDELHVSESQMAIFFGVGALAWYVKPLAGLVVDRIALFGTHHRHYLVASSLLAAALWLLLGLVSHSYYLLLVLAIAIQSMLVVGSTVLGGFLVERGKLLRAEGRLVSCRTFIEHACLLIAGPLAGYLAGLPFGATAAIGAAIAIAIAPVAVVCVTEPAQDKPKLVGTSQILDQLKLYNSRSTWLVAIFLFVCNVPQSFGTPLYFYQKNVLAFSDIEIGYLTAVAGGGALLASTMYPFLCRRMPMQAILILGTLGPSIGIIAYLFYISIVTAFIVEFASGFLFGIGTLALMQSAVISTLTSSAAFGFAVFMSASNAGAAIGDILAALMVEYASMTLFDVVALFVAVSAACCMFVYCLPRGLLSHQEGRL